MMFQCRLKLFLIVTFRKCKKTQIIVAFCQFLRQFSLWKWKPIRIIRNRSTSSVILIGAHIIIKCSAAPAILYRSLNIKNSFLCCFTFLNNQNMVHPRHITKHSRKR